MSETLEPALPRDLDQLAECWMRSLCDSGLKVATAESCTGGLLAALLTDVPGCSHAFERGFVVYTHEAKAQMLDIDLDRIEELGAVSKEIAIEMAHGALRRSEADVALSITGFAGPGKAGEEEGWSISPARAATARPRTAASISARSGARACGSPRSRRRWR